MIRNFFITVYRNIMRNKFFSSINIVGLSVGIAAFVLIMLFVEREYNFDRHFKDADQIYRVTLDMEWEQAPTQYAALSPAPVAIHLVREFPEVVAGTRFITSDQRMFEAIEENGQVSGRKFYEDNIFTVDSNFFKVFEIDIVAGNKKTMLTNPNSIVLSESLAEKYFESKEVVGKIIRMDNEQDLVVSGIMKDLPSATHFQTDILLTSVGAPNFEINNWRDFLYSYIKVAKNTDLSDIDKKLFDFKEKFYAPWKETSTFRLQKMQDIHLKNDRIFDYAVTGDIKNVFFLISIAILVLILACINFTNLLTARSIYRSKEVGVRKVVGASRKKLIIQFLGESMMVASIAMLLAIILIELFLPEFRRIINADISLDYAQYLLGFIGLALVVGFLSGSYPAFFTSSFKPIAVLTDRTSSSGGNVLLRRILVVFQFVVMVILLSGVFIIFQQMKYVKNKPLGFDKDLIIHTSINDNDFGRLQHLLKEKLLTHPNIEKAFLASQLPGETPFGDHFLVEGIEKSFPARTSSIGYDYIPSLGIEILAGRNFSKEFGTEASSCIINEAAMKKFGWNIDNVLGKEISWGFAANRDNQIFGHVIGVVKDYHFKSLHEEIEPIVLTMYAPWNQIVSAKINPNNINETIKFIEQSYKEINPGYPFEYGFLDKDFEELYKREKLFEKIFRYFVVLAILIASLGLLGLSAFVTEKKFKEIGVRKTFGASLFSIVKLFTKEFAVWVIIANVIGFPLSLVIMNRWLENFSYHISIPWWLFIVVFIISYIIAIGTVGYMALKAARKNPVEALQYE